MAGIYVGENIAVKALSFSADFRELNELLLHLSMKHDYIVETHGIMSGDDLVLRNIPGSLGLIMDRYECSLWKYIPSNHKSIMLQIAYGLKYLHDNGIVHCDLHPKNVLVKDNHIAITDFGLSTFANMKHLAEKVLLENSHLPLQDINDSSIVYKSYDIWSLALLFTFIHGHMRIYDELANRTQDEILTILTTDGQLNDLLVKMLKYDQSERIDINEVIEHSFFDDIRDKFEYRNGNRIEKCISNTHNFLMSYMGNMILRY